MQLKLDQRRGSERTRQYELDKIKIKIDTIVYDANKVLNKIKFDQKYME